LEARRVEAEELRAKILNLELKMQSKDEELRSSRAFGEGKRAEVKELKANNLSLDARV